MSTGDELREALAGLPNRPGIMAAMTAARDNPASALRPVWAILLAELADIDAQERATLRELEDGIVWPLRTPRRER